MAITVYSCRVKSYMFKSTRGGGDLIESACVYLADSSCETMSGTDEKTGILFRVERITAIISHVERNCILIVCVCVCETIEE